MRHRAPPFTCWRQKQPGRYRRRTGGDSPVPTLQGPCSRSPKLRGSLRFLPPLEMRPSSIAPNPAESREALPTTQPGLERSPEGEHGNSLQCFCLENPRDGGAWWAAVYGVAQGRTQLKRPVLRIEGAGQVLGTITLVSRPAVGAVGSAQTHI